MLLEGVELMVVGMGTVFAFLSLLVLMMHATAKVIAAIEPAPVFAATVAGNDDGEIAVVLAAVAAARQARRGQ
jgi:oxaloacetate decarboxylase (Na+ extruding) subunit gamma